MKKILNNTDELVHEMCEGMVLACPEKLSYLPKYKIIIRKKLNPHKVTLLSGGGSGHEPAHAGYVGYGMLDGAVCGDVFASPSSMQVYNAVKQTRSDKGTLLIVKNYSGDCMNFDMAAEMAKDDDGISVEKVYVNDDIAVKNSSYTIGRRGVCGTVFVHKIAGAAAEKGFDLPEVKRVAEKAIANTRSIGFAFTSCTVPQKGTPTFSLAEDEMEYGVGIHGEPGVAREKLATSKALAGRMIDALIEDLKLMPGEKIGLIVNGFGATPLQELYILNRDVNNRLAEQNIQVYRNFVGNFMTSIDMAGASVSLIRLDEEMTELLDFPADTSAFKI